MSKFADYGVMHFNIECDQFVAARSRYLTAQEFLAEAIREDAGWKLAIDKSWNEAELFNNLFPYVSDNAYVIHRVGECPSDPNIDDWWAFVDGPGKSHVKVWVLDMVEVKQRLKLGEPI